MSEVAKSKQRPHRRPARRRRSVRNPFGSGNARATAYDLATHAFKGDMPFDHIWGADTGLSSLPRRDRSLAVYLGAGVLRSKRRLDALARMLTDGKSDGLPEAIRWVLLLGLFQVFEADRIPPHAAVSTAVEAAKVASHAGIAGLVNAVLRRAIREKSQIVAALTGPDISRAERLSLPDWLDEVLATRFPQATFDQIDHWVNHPPHYYLRLRDGQAGLKRLNEILSEMELPSAMCHHEFPNYASVSTAALVHDSPVFSEPLGWVQSPAAGLVVQFLNPQPGETVVDLFAAPGGKSMAIAESVGTDGTVLAVDKSENRLERLTENKLRLGFDNILPICGDSSALGDRVAQRVLADVPCSALGTLPKNPEVRWTKSPKDVTRLALSQRIWLTEAAKHVAPGGTLVYATCTLTVDENEDVVRFFLAEHPEFSIDESDAPVPGKYISSEGHLTTNPPVDGLDGVFAARLKRNDS